MQRNNLKVINKHLVLYLSYILIKFIQKVNIYSVKKIFSE